MQVFEARIAQRVADLRVGITAAGLSRDPYRHLVEGYIDMLELLPELVRQVQRTAGQTLSPEDAAALIARVEAGARQAAEQGGNAGMRREAARLIRGADRRLSITIGIAIGAAFIAGYLVAFLAMHLAGAIR